MLDVEHPLALAAVLEHEVAKEARGRPFGQRAGGEAVEDVLAVRGPGEGRREPLGRRRRAPDRIALDDHREQHQAAVAIGVLDPRSGGALPLVDRAGEQRARGDRALGVERQPARRQTLQNPPRRGRSSPPGAAGSSPPSQASAQSTSELGNGSRRPKLPIANHVYGAGGRPSSSSAISISRRVIVSWMLAIVRLIAAAGTSESWSAITVSGSSAAASATPAASTAGGDPGPQVKRSTPLAREQVDVVEHADEAPIGPEHGQVPDAVVEHLEQRLGLRAVRGHGPGGRGHHVPRAASAARRRRRRRGCGCRGR